jgi:hypothetical protein
MGDRRSEDDLNFLYFWNTTNTVQAGVGKEGHLKELQNLEVDGYWQETNKVFEYLRYLWQGCPCTKDVHASQKNEQDIVTQICSDNLTVEEIQERRILSHILQGLRVS